MTAFDLVEKAVSMAKQRMADTGEMSGTLEVYQANVFELDKTPFRDQKFDTVLDSAIFHCIGDDDAQRRYVEAISKYVRKGGRFLMHVFSDQNPDPWVGPRRISEAHVRTFFNETTGWKVDIRPAFFEDSIRAEGEGKSIFMVAERMVD